MQNTHPELESRGNRVDDFNSWYTLQTYGIKLRVIYLLALSHIVVVLMSRGEASTAGSELGAANRGAGEPETGGGDPQYPAGQGATP